jgi:hypothetical protein
MILSEAEKYKNYYKEQKEQISQLQDMLNGEKARSETNRKQMERLRLKLNVVENEKQSAGQPKEPVAGKKRTLQQFANSQQSLDQELPAQSP